ncbi:response regulator transcription factor [Arthrobacter crusticola]|uniref:Response regulator transcription factor n=1 Tax=Arthrobacter crusticola TaxID=2547960 RepID=A0A4R5TS95_9MICC|nr:response regulator transcription factor [Arthrobacter crusticola]TDK23680.1 response regulator transcription factor [Arthrobacter crusticola]
MIRVLIADDQVIVRAGLSILLDSAADITVVGEAENGREAIRLTTELRPDVVCMDIRMPVMDGVAATRIISADASLSSEILILTTFDIDDDIFAALEAGAAGFLLKGADEDTLLNAIRSVAQGDGTLDQRLTRRILQEFVQRRPSTPPAGVRKPLPSPLTDREIDVLQLLAQGLSNAEIAKQLFVEQSTIKYHLAHLLQKTGARDRLQIVLWGIRTGTVNIE